MYTFLGVLTTIYVLLILILVLINFFSMANPLQPSQPQKHLIHQPLFTATLLTLP